MFIRLATVLTTEGSKLNEFSVDWKWHKRGLTKCTLAEYVASSNGVCVVVQNKSTRSDQHTVVQFTWVTCNQCDQIWRFIGLWATFKSFWQQLIFPNLSHSQGIFVKESKSIIFLVKSYLGKFYRHLAIFSGHTACYSVNRNFSETCIH